VPEAGQKASGRRGSQGRVAVGWLADRHGAQALLANRYSAEQDERFVAGMRAEFGL
jgi:hypothetical protein